MIFTSRRRSLHQFSNIRTPPCNAISTSFLETALRVLLRLRGQSRARFLPLQSFLQRNQLLLHRPTPRMQRRRYQLSILVRTATQQLQDRWFAYHLRYFGLFHEAFQEPMDVGSCYSPRSSYQARQMCEPELGLQVRQLCQPKRICLKILQVV